MTVSGRHLLMALLLHGLLFGLMTASLSCTVKPPEPVVIEAVLLDPSRKQAAQIKQEQAQQQQRVEQERIIEEQKREAEAETERQRVALVKKQTELANKKKSDDAAKKKREEALELKRKQEALEQRQKEKLQEDLKQKRQAEERQRKLELLEAQQREQLLTAEDDERRQNALMRERDTARAQWLAQITQRIEQNWRRPPEISGKIRCTVEIKQLPGGQIVNRRLTKSCGNALLDESVLRAVDKSEPLPVPTDSAIFDRELVVNFAPHDE